MNESPLITVESIVNLIFKRSHAITNNSSAPCVWTDMFIISHARVADNVIRAFQNANGTGV